MSRFFYIGVGATDAHITEYYDQQRRLPVTKKSAAVVQGIVILPDKSAKRVSAME